MLNWKRKYRTLCVSYSVPCEQGNNICWEQEPQTHFAIYEWNSLLEVNTSQLLQFDHLRGLQNPNINAPLVSIDKDRRTISYPPPFRG
jgi:hypothetical protein